MRIRFGLLLSIILTSSGCASIYVNDPGLAKQADTADTGIQAADTIKPYSVQLVNLQSFTAQQDLAIAQRDITTRDSLVAGIIGADPSVGTKIIKSGATLRSAQYPRETNLDKEICDRLGALTGGSPCLNPDNIAYFSERYDTISRIQDQDQQTVASTLATYERTRGDDKFSDDCESLEKSDPKRANTNDQTDLSNLIDACSRLSSDKLALDSFATTAFTSGSPIAAVLSAVNTAPPPPQVTQAASDALKALQGQIDAANIASTTGDVPALADFQKNVEAALSDGAAAANVIKLTTLQSTIGQLLDGTLCAGKTPVAGVDCTNIQAASTPGRAAAVWPLLQAIAQSMDASDPHYRSANWLAAANAILTAAKTTTQIEADAEKQAKASAKLRFVLLATGASNLAQAHMIIAGKTACNASRRSSCALAAYVAAWNEGLIPADILAYREPLAFAETSLKVQLAAATEQKSLTAQASASLKAYADGGVQAATIAQLIADASLIGIAANR